MNINGKYYETLWDTCDPEAETEANEIGDIDDRADAAYDDYIQFKGE